jgi:hypothetical protein
MQNKSLKTFTFYIMCSKLVIWHVCGMSFAGYIYVITAREETLTCIQSNTFSIQFLYIAVFLDEMIRLLEEKRLMHSSR